VDGHLWYLPLPVGSYWVSSEFGYRVHPTTGQIDSYHKGIDLAAAEGTPIFAVRDGVVRVTAYDAGGGGFYVSLGHTGSYISVYMHMTHYIVKPGQRVTAGQIIGYVGSTGAQSTGNHLHLGIAKDGTYMNPRLFFDF
jgi:murein DD-endopeptidase MepM/ murein hydrolase activator NlpD